MQLSVCTGKMEIFVFGTAAVYHILNHTKQNNVNVTCW